jgi:CheY-like chemotaxis protein
VLTVFLPTAADLSRCTGYIRPVPQNVGYVWSEQPPTPRPLRVLVVDNDADTVFSLLAVLRTEGYVAMGAGSGAAALQILEGFDPDAVILDIAMPQMNGWEAAREIRKRQSQGRPMLIAVTGAYVKKPDELMSRAAGFDHFLVKPADPDFLLNILGAIIPK